MAELTREQVEIYGDAITCEKTLFKQLTDATDAAADTLKQTPETEKILTTVSALEIVRACLDDLSSGDAERIAAGAGLLGEIADL